CAECKIDIIPVVSSSPISRQGCREVRAGSPRYHSQNVAQKSASVRALDFCDFFRRSNGNDFPALIPGFGSEIDDPIGRFNDFQIVLDYDKRMPGFNQTLEKLEQDRNVIEMEARCRFIENEQIAANGRSGEPRGLGIIARARWRALVHQMADQFQSLGFATTQRIQRLPQSEIT